MWQNMIEFQMGIDGVLFRCAWIEPPNPLMTPLEKIMIVISV
jgi:hypothetical protein